MICEGISQELWRDVEWAEWCMNSEGMPCELCSNAVSTVKECRKNCEEMPCEPWNNIVWTMKECRMNLNYEQECRMRGMLHELWRDVEWAECCMNWERMSHELWSNVVWTATKCHVKFKKSCAVMSVPNQIFNAIMF